MIHCFLSFQHGILDANGDLTAQTIVQKSSPCKCELQICQNKRNILLLQKIITTIAPDEGLFFFSLKKVPIFFLFLHENVFSCRIKKKICEYPLLSGAMYHILPNCRIMHLIFLKLPENL